MKAMFVSAAVALLSAPTACSPSGTPLAKVGDGRPEPFAAAYSIMPASAESPSDRPDAEDARKQAEADTARDAALFPTATQSDCDSPPGRPVVCLVPATRAVRLDQPLDYVLRWRGVPEGSGVVISIENGAPAAERRRYIGAAGPLMLAPLKIRGSGEKRIQWNGHDIGCAPADAPMWCQGVERGRYRLVGQLYDTASFAFLGWPDPRPRKQIAWTRSPMVDIQGPIDIGVALRGDQLSLTRFLWRQGYRKAFYDREVLKHVGPTRGGWRTHCADIALLAPLTGSIEACVPKSTVDEFGIKARPAEISYGGKIRYLVGILPMAEAEIAARKVARPPYERLARYTGFPTAALDEPDRDAVNQRTWLESGISDAALRNEGGPYWLFLIRESVKTVQGSPAGPSDHLLVRVEMNGRACLVDKGPSGDFRPDIDSQDAGLHGLTSAQKIKSYNPALWQRPCPTN